MSWTGTLPTLEGEDILTYGSEEIGIQELDGID
jgi:hypothetical protein